MVILPGIYPTPSASGACQNLPSCDGALWPAFPSASPRTKCLRMAFLRTENREPAADSLPRQFLPQHRRIAGEAKAGFQIHQA